MTSAVILASDNSSKNLLLLAFLPSQFMGSGHLVLRRQDVLSWVVVDGIAI